MTSTKKMATFNREYQDLLQQAISIHQGEYVAF